jgi:hypothetical protein
LYLVLYFFALAINVGAQTENGTIIPAGTLLQCTLSEPNFSSATVAVGDPVVCYLKSVQQFGHIVLPRGSYLQGHLAEAKDPGHFVGKGYMRIEFDNIGLPSMSISVPSKVIAASGGYKTDRNGDILGKGHAKRDVVEWLFPPLWPYKIIMLPARGPRPTFKGEELLTLRLMDDIEVPKMADVKPEWHSFNPTSASPQDSDNFDQQEPQQQVVAENLAPPPPPMVVRQAYYPTELLPGYPLGGVVVSPGVGLQLGRSRDFTRGYSQRYRYNNSRNFSQPRNYTQPRQRFAR